MKISLTKSEIVERLRLIAGLAPLRTDGTIEYTDGIDINAILEERLRAWYLKLLDSGDAIATAAEDISSLATVSMFDAPAGGTIIKLPRLCRRVFSIQMQGWNRACPILTPDWQDTVIALQQNPFSEAKADRPIAVMGNDFNAGSVPSIMVWPYDNAVTTLIGCMDPGPDHYVLDEAALDGLNDIAKSLNL